MADRPERKTPAEIEQVKYQAELNEYGMPGRMYLLAPDDMTHESYAHYQKISGAKDVNVYVDTQDKSQDPHVKYLPDSNGNAMVIINDAEHQYSEKYARNTLYSDHQIQKLIENKKLVPVTRDNLNGAMSLETFDKYQALAKKMLPEGSKIPDLYLDYTQYADDYAQAATGLSKEGSPYIVLNPPRFKPLAENDKLAWLGHELGHQRNGDTTAKGIVRRHNDRTYQASQSSEKNADLVSIGPFGSCDPYALLDATQALQKIEAAAFFKNNPNATYKDLVNDEAKEDKTHPTLNARINYLTMAGMDLISAPDDPCKLHSPVTPTVDKPAFSKTLTPK